MHDHTYVLRLFCLCVLNIRVLAVDDWCAEQVLLFVNISSDDEKGRRASRLSLSKRVTMLSNVSSRKADFPQVTECG